VLTSAIVMGQKRAHGQLWQLRWQAVPCYVRLSGSVLIAAPYPPGSRAALDVCADVPEFLPLRVIQF